MAAQSAGSTTSTTCPGGWSRACRGLHLSREEVNKLRAAGFKVSSRDNRSFGKNVYLVRDEYGNIASGSTLANILGPANFEQARFGFRAPRSD